MINYTLQTFSYGGSISSMKKRGDSFVNVDDLLPIHKRTFVLKMHQHTLFNRAFKKPLEKFM